MKIGPLNSVKAKWKPLLNHQRNKSYITPRSWFAPRYPRPLTNSSKNIFPLNRVIRHWSLRLQHSRAPLRTLAGKAIEAAETIVIHRTSNCLWWTSVNDLQLSHKKDDSPISSNTWLMWEDSKNHKQVKGNQSLENRGKPTEVNTNKLQVSKILTNWTIYGINGITVI